MGSEGKPMAWVTLATTDAYALGALVLAHSLRQAGTAHQLVVMITPGVTETMRSQLSGAFDDVISVDVLDSCDAAHLALMARPELGVTLTKLHCWTLTQFAKCVFLDADCLVMTNCDELFERDQLSAAPDIGWPDCFNSGVFVFTPSDDTFRALVQLAADTGSFDGGDQGLLNTYFSDWATRDISRHLPFVYNMTASATYTYLPAFLRFGQDVKIVHFLGSNKPWMRADSGDASSPAGRFHAAWWELYQSRVRRADDRGHQFLELPSAGAPPQVFCALSAPPLPSPPPTGSSADCPSSVFRERAVEPLWAGDQRQSGGRRPPPLFDYTHTPHTAHGSHTASPAPVHVRTPPPPPAAAPAAEWNPPSPAPASTPVWNPPPAPAGTPPPAPAPAPTAACTPAPTPTPPQPKNWTPPGPPPPHRPWSAEPEAPRSRSGDRTHQSRPSAALGGSKHSANTDVRPKSGKQPQQPSVVKHNTTKAAGSNVSGSNKPPGQSGQDASGAKVPGTKSGTKVSTAIKKQMTTSPGTAGTKVQGTRVSGTKLSGAKLPGVKRAPGTKPAATSQSNGAARATDAESLEQRRRWEEGRIDFAGADRFDNVWLRITASLEQREPAPAESGAEQPGALHGELVGGLAQLAVTPAASSPEEAARRAAWERGQMDYMGSDSFDNILNKINQTLQK